MNVLITILSVIVVLSFLVFIHEGGHYLAARSFGVRVTEFMIGLPGPRIGFMKNGTKFGVTAVPLGGYARICGMEPGPESPYLEQALAYSYAMGSVTAEDFATHASISSKEAEEALDQLVFWGSLDGVSARKKDTIYKTPIQKKGQVAGSQRPVDDAHEFYLSEKSQQYRTIAPWKRCIIVLAGPLVNIVFALLAFVVIYSCVGVDMLNPNTGVVEHVMVSPLKALTASFVYLGMVIQAVAQLFNPATAADTISQSTSIVGIAVLSKSALDQGFINFVLFTAMISVSLGIMNLLPILPLDGGRFVIELYQKITRRTVSEKAMEYLSLAGIAFVLLLFIIMLNQDVQHFIFGN